ncbi:MAG: ROK family protein [Bacilli bacterium]|jgi:glucokinase|nr:ROK family protein [Bacilli bacterium]
MNKKIVSLDIGGTYIKGAVISEQGEILLTSAIPFPRGQITEEMDKIAAFYSSLVSSFKEEELLCLGIGCPGLINCQKGEVYFAGHLGWKNLFLAEELERRIHKPVVVLNDASAACWGDYRFGAGKDFSNLVFLTLGTGLGSSLIFDGKLWLGNGGLTPELGYLSIDPKGKKGPNGKRGLLEASISASALLEDAYQSIKDDKSSLLWSLCEGKKEQLNGEMIFSAYEKKDKVAKKALKAYYERLSQGVIDLIDMLEPEAVIFGGGLSERQDKFLSPLTKAMEKKTWLSKGIVEVKLLCSPLGNKAGLIGAGIYAFERMNQEDKERWN